MTQRYFFIRRALDGSWTTHPQPPLAATSSFLTGGWKAIDSLRQFYDAIDWFPISEDYAAFRQEFGDPPHPRVEPEPPTSTLS